MAITADNKEISFGDLKGIRLTSDTLMDRNTGLNILDGEHLKNCLVDILTTPRGSRVMLRDYGCGLFQLIDRPLNRDLVVEMYSIIHSAIMKWEPRILVTKLGMDASRWPYGQLSITLEGHYLLENGPLRISDLSLDFMANNQYAITDPERGALDYEVSNFAELAAEQDDQYVLAFVGDIGLAGAAQTAQANRMKSWNPDAFLLAGDLNYYEGEGRTIMANTAVFEDEIQQGKVFPAVGNHEENYLKGFGDLTPHLQRYYYLPGNRRYYKQSLFNGLVTLFVINTGYATSGALRLEPDGNTVDSLQYQWLTSELEKVNSPYVLLMGHHPFLTKTSGGSGMVFPQLAWIKHLPKVQMYLHGHTHTGQHHIYAPSGRLKMHILDVSCGVADGRNMSVSGTTYGETSGTQVVWQFAPDGEGASGPSCVAKLTVLREFLLVEVMDADSGAVLHNFTIQPWA